MAKGIPADTFFVTPLWAGATGNDPGTGESLGLNGVQRAQVFGSGAVEFAMFTVPLAAAGAVWAGEAAMYVAANPRFNPVNYRLSLPVDGTTLSGGFPLGGVKLVYTGGESGPSAKFIHDVFVKIVRPGFQETPFEVFVNKQKIGLRRFDDFEIATKTGFEGNTIPWAEMTEVQLSRKLDQAAMDFALLNDGTGRVARIIWFGTDPLPTTGLGAQIGSALQQAGITYWVVVE